MKKSFKDHAYDGIRDLGDKSDTVLKVTSKIAAVTTAATIAATIGKYGAKFIYKALTKK